MRAFSVQPPSEPGVPAFRAPGSPAIYAACATGLAWIQSWHGAQTMSVLPGFFIGVAGAGLNYSLVISIMVFLSVGRVVVRLSRRCAGFHAPVGLLS